MLEARTCDLEVARIAGTGEQSAYRRVGVRAAEYDGIAVTLSARNAGQRLEIGDFGYWHGRADTSYCRPSP